MWVTVWTVTLLWSGDTWHAGDAEKLLKTMRLAGKSKIVYNARSSLPFRLADIDASLFVHVHSFGPDPSHLAAYRWGILSRPQ